MFTSKKNHVGEKLKAGLSRRAVLAMSLSLALTSVLAAPAHADDVVRVGTTPSSKPSAFLNPATNTVDGIMPDIVNEIAKREHLKLQFNPMPFSTLVQSLVSDKVDIIVAGMTVTAQRAQVVDFSTPVYQLSESLVLPDSNKNNYKSVQDLKGMNIGLPSGTTYTAIISKLPGFKSIKYYDSPSDLVSDLRAGRVDAIFEDAPIVGWMAMGGNLNGVHADPDYTPVITGDVAVAVKKGDKPLLDKINAGIAAMKADGTLDKILAKWHIKK